ncbi:MAG TPA: iron-containing alcohol dehydrogenase [Victivallales bacterium]|nr:iron-containing alcohol dehydrogenase [Victivallales bacterium]
MIEGILSDTKIVQLDSLTACELDEIINYTSPDNGKVCFVCDNNPLDFREALVNEYKKIRDICLVDKVYPDPKVQDIMDMVNEVKNEQISTVIGIGGGSTLDSAKAVALTLSNGGDLDDYLGPNPSRKIENKKVKLILIPTTAGTGAEVTKFGVYSARSGRKYTLANPLMQADVAVLVSEFTYKLPASITAATAFDALSHALEALWNNNATDVSDIAATEAAVSVLEYMDGAYDDAVNGEKNARTKMLEASCRAGIAFNMTGTAAVHALSFIFSEEWHIPHGTACAFTLEDIMLLNMKNDKAKQKLLKVAGRIFSDETDDNRLLDKLYNHIVSLKKKFHLPMKLSDLNISMLEKDIKPFFNKSLDDPKMWNNILPVNEDIVYGVIKNKL